MWIIFSEVPTSAHNQFIYVQIADGGALRSLSEMGAMLTMFTTNIKPGSRPINASTSSGGGAAG